MSNLEMRPERIEKESESVKPDSILHDYVNLMKGNSDVATGLPSTPADKNLPALVTEDSGRKEKAREGSDIVTSGPESKARDCVDDLMKKLNISMDQQTDLDVMKDILHNDMKLDDCPAVLKLLGSRLTDKESMTPMLERVRESIITKQPELHEFISTALKENLIPTPDENGQKWIVRSLNHMVLLDALTKGMADDPQFMEDIRNHLMDKRKNMGIHEGFLSSFHDMYKIYKPYGDLFGPVKVKSVDAGIDLIREFRKSGHVDKFDSQKMCAVLGVNIAEAVLADGLHGFSKNARAGLELDLHPATKVWVSGDNRSVNFNLSQDWDSLYESWNMAFIAGNRPNHQLLFPKLLIPQVIDAKPEEYIYNRALALWLTENFQLFNRIEKKAPVVIPGGAEMAKRWGEINLAYGRHLGEMHGTGG